jgi:Phosphotransferase enzyme family
MRTAGGAERRLILLRDADGQARNPDKNVAVEAAAMTAARLAGVPVAEIYDYGEGDLGQSYLLMERLDGETIPRRLLRDEAYAAVRPGLARRLGEILARIHQVDPDSVPGLPRVDALGHSGDHAAILGPGTEGRLARTGRQRGVGVVHPVAQQRPGLARVDDLLDTEPFRSPQRAAHGVEPGPDAGQGGGWIFRAFQLSSVGGLGPAFDWQRAPVGRGPGPPADEAVPVGHARPAHTEHAAHDDLGTWPG